jgi:hypothetical protein
MAEELRVIGTMLAGFEIGASKTIAYLTVYVSEGKHEERLIRMCPVVNLEKVVSGYFSIQELDGTKYALATEAFERERPILDAQPQFQEFGSFIEALLPLFRDYRDCLSALYLLAMGDGGVTFACEPLVEVVRALTNRYANPVFVHSQMVSSEDRQAICDLLRQCITTAIRRLTILRESVKHLDTIGDVGAARARGLAKYAYPLPTDSFLWDVLERLARMLGEIGDALLGDSGEGASTRLAEAHRRLAGAAPGHPGQRLEVGHVYWLLVVAVCRWLRAINNEYDYPCFRRHTCDPQQPGTLSPYVLCFDIREFTRNLDEAARKYGAFSVVEFGRWRNAMGAIPKNWAIVFGGLVSKPEGDQEIAYFPAMWPAATAAALALEHVGLLDGLSRKRDRLPMGWAAAIGSGSMFVWEENDTGQPINYAFHKIKEADAKPPASEYSFLVADARFLQQEPELADYRQGEEFAYRDGMACSLDYHGIARRFREQFDSGSGFGKSAPLQAGLSLSP